MHFVRKVLVLGPDKEKRVRYVKLERERDIERKLERDRKEEVDYF